MSTSTAQRWPDLRIEGAEILLDEGDTRIAVGRSTDHGQDVVVSQRDLGEDGSANFYDEEIARLSHLRCSAAARVLDARIVEDRYLMLTVLRPHGLMISARLSDGPLDPEEAVIVAVAALEVMAGLHELNLSATGMRLRSSVRSRGIDGAVRITLTTFGLAVDNGIDMFNELRELGLRILSLMGGRYDGSLIVPEAVGPALAAIFERAFGLSGPAFSAPSELAVALLQAVGKKARVAPRSRTTTRPHRQTGPVVTSDLLLASEYLATLPTESPPPDTNLGLDVARR